MYHDSTKLLTKLPLTTDKLNHLEKLHESKHYFRHDQAHSL